MICVGKVGSTVYSAVLDERAPSGRYEYMIDGFFGDTVIADPRPVVNHFPGEAEISMMALSWQLMVNFL